MAQRLTVGELIHKLQSLVEETGLVFIRTDGPIPSGIDLLVVDSNGETCIHSFKEPVQEYL